MTDPVRLTVTRPANAWRDILRAYPIVLDGTVIGQLRRGETLARPIQPGDHSLQARIDWTGSPPLTFNATPGTDIHFEVRPAGNPLNIFWQAFTTTRWLHLKRLP